MKTALALIAGLSPLAGILLGIWLQDWRWIATGVVFLFAAALVGGLLTQRKVAREMEKFNAELDAPFTAKRWSGRP